VAPHKDCFLLKESDPVDCWNTDLLWCDGCLEDLRLHKEAKGGAVAEKIWHADLLMANCPPSLPLRLGTSKNTFLEVQTMRDGQE
jgi:hypothetical protein